jgi:hypothetical protein
MPLSETLQLRFGYSKHQWRHVVGTESYLIYVQEIEMLFLRLPGLSPAYKCSYCAFLSPPASRVGEVKFLCHVDTGGGGSLDRGEWSASLPRPSRWETVDCPPQLWHGPCCFNVFN